MAATTANPSIEDAIALIASALNEDAPLGRVLSDLERALLVAAKHRHGNWNRVHIALKIPRTSLYKKRLRYEIG